MKSICKLLFVVMLLASGAVQGIKAQGDIDYQERSWDEATQTVKTVTKTKHAGEYTVISGYNTDDDGWIGLYDGWYVVTSESAYKTLNVLGTDVHLIICSHTILELTGGVKLLSGHKLSVYSQGGEEGKLWVENCYTSGAGIGSGYRTDGNAGLLVVHGGNIYAEGNLEAAGIGGSNLTGFDPDPAKGGLIVYGGSVTAKGSETSEAGAGIGSGYLCANETAGHVTIYGGEVHATGGGPSAVLSDAYGGAGIGGGDGAAGAIVHIYGGNVTAQSNAGGAGIGGGTRGAGKETYIHGGQVDAASSTGAGIGGGSNAADGGKIVIDGGEVRANSGGAGIGCGSQGSYADIVINGGKVFAYGPVAIGVYAGDGVSGAGSKLSLYDGAMVRSGSNPGVATLVSAADRTTACTSNSFAYIEPCTHSNATYTDINNYTHTRQCGNCLTAFQPEQHSLDDTGKCVCGFEHLNLVLNDEYTHRSEIYENRGRLADVTFSGRTLYKDGSWNTLCLPFSLDSFDGTPLEGATVKTFDSTTFNDGTLTLNFSDDHSSIEACVPFIVKWEAQTPDRIVDPVFKDVIIQSKSTVVSQGSVQFIGLFEPSYLQIQEEDRTVLFMGGNNELFYPLERTVIGPFRAYFKLSGQLAGVKSIGLNFDDSAPTAIDVVNAGAQTINGAVYNLSGQRVSQPTKGIYIINGKKVMMK